MLDFIRSRRSTRAYRSDPVDREKIEAVLEAGRYAPSGGNSQTCHFLVIRDPEVLASLTRRVEAAFARMEEQPGMYASVANSIRRSKAGGYDFRYGAPVLIVVMNRTDYGNNIADSACALENMMLMANALDLGSCWINQLKWLNGDPEMLSFLSGLGMRDDEKPWGALALGYPATPDGLPERTPLPRRGNDVTWVG